MPGPLVGVWGRIRALTIALDHADHAATGRFGQLRTGAVQELAQAFPGLPVLTDIQDL
jgi:hypothetical protein